MSEFNPITKSFDVSDIVVLGGLAGVIYVISKSGVFTATQGAGDLIEKTSAATGGVVTKTGQVIETYMDWLPLQPSYNEMVYGFGYQFGQWTGKVQQNLIGFGEKIKGLF